MADIYDVAVIGGGVTGLSTACSLAKYSLKTCVLEKASDVGFGVSKANSGIVHGGFHYPLTTLKGRLEIQGNLMFEQLAHLLHFPYKKCGILLAAFSDEELATARKLYERGIENGVPGIEFCSRERVMELEPKISKAVVGAVFAPNGGVVEPYKYAFSLAEFYRLNGGKIALDQEVVKAEFCKEKKLWKIGTGKGEEFLARFVVNAAGLYADKVSEIFGGESFQIIPRKGEEYLLDRSSPAYPNCVIFPVPSGHSKGVLVIPTAGGTTMIGPTAEELEDKEDVSTSTLNKEKIFALAKNMVSGISEKDLITSFSGSRPALESGDFFIAISEKAPSFIQASGIQSPGLTASPAVGEYIKDLLRNAGLAMEEKTVILYPEKTPQIRELSDEEADRLHKDDPAWTNIICRCEKISEAEIIAAIRKGHTTVDGIKFHTRAGMGRCQGGFCSYKIWKIIARETNTPLEELTKKGGASLLASGILGEENEEKEMKS